MISDQALVNVLSVGKISLLYSNISLNGDQGIWIKTTFDKSWFSQDKERFMRTITYQLSSLPEITVNKVKLSATNYNFFTKAWQVVKIMTYNQRNKGKNTNFTFFTNKITKGEPEEIKHDRFKEKPNIIEKMKSTPPPLVDEEPNLLDNAFLSQTINDILPFNLS